jgi:hypothetical protein
MIKIVLKICLLILLFLITWFLLSQIDWLALLPLEIIRAHGDEKLCALYVSVCN